jgi:hypothetical protein
MTSQHPTFHRTRAETRERITPVTINGHTQLVPEKYTVQVPVPPRDWDHLVLNGVTTVTAAILTASVTWSTTSIGSLLSRAVEPAIAYGTATAFDLVWIVCMAVEWLSRYNPAAAVLPRRAGHIALLVAMGSVCTNGLLTGGRAGIAVGLVGAVVSALAKGTWTIVMRHTAKPLDHLTQGWVDRRMAEAGGRLALAAVDRQLARVEGQWADTMLALPTGPDADKAPERADSVSATVRSAVLAALATVPDADPEAVVEMLARIGIRTDSDTVREVSGQHADTTDSRSAGLLDFRAKQADQAITDTVRRLVRDGITDSDTALPIVRWFHGDTVAKATVDRLIRRVSA